MKKTFLVSIALAGLLALTASAETQLSFYGGHQSAPHSRVVGEYDGTSFDFIAGWEGKPFAMPPYYGIRYTTWRESDWGFSVDFSHSKVYSDDETRAASGFEVLEFTDGVNVLTVNAVRRFQNPGNWTPYFGAGVGIAIPHVEVQVDEFALRTFKYQYGGPALQLQGGVEYSVSDRWSVFTEYKINYAMLDVDLDGPSDNFLETNIITNALNIGVSYGF